MSPHPGEQSAVSHTADPSFLPIKRCYPDLPPTSLAASSQVLWLAPAHFIIPYITSVCTLSLGDSSSLMALSIMYKWMTPIFVTSARFVH